MHGTCVAARKRKNLLSQIGWKQSVQATLDAECPKLVPLILHARVEDEKEVAVGPV